MTRKTRDQVAVEYTWNLNDLFESQEAWEQELTEIIQHLPVVTAFKGQLQKSGETLLACLEASEAINVRANIAASYARLRSSEDGTNPQNQANSARVGDVLSQLNAALSFIPSEILALPIWNAISLLLPKNMRIYQRQSNICPRGGKVH